MASKLLTVSLVGIAVEVVHQLVESPYDCLAPLAVLYQEC